MTRAPAIVAAMAAPARRGAVQAACLISAVIWIAGHLAGPAALSAQALSSIEFSFSNPGARSLGFGVAFKKLQLDLGIDLLERIDTASVSAIYSS